MPRIIAGLMGGSVASVSASMTGSSGLQPVLEILKQHNVREIDTARVYNGGQSEEDLGSIPEAQKEFSIATKAPGFGGGSLSYENVIKNCEASLQALKQSKIDLYYFHGPDRKTPLEDSCRAMHDLHTQGKIVRFGVSNYSPDEVKEIHAICTKNGWLVPTVYQGAYNPLMRMLEVALFPVLKELSMVFYAYSPLGGGFFSRSTEALRGTAESGSRMDAMPVFKTIYVNGVSLPLHEKLSDACGKEGIGMKEATLRWIMRHSALREQDGVILGASSLQQMKQNLVACGTDPLPDSVVECFEEMWRVWDGSGKAPGFL